MRGRSTEPETVLDLRGLKCPLPVLRLRKTLAVTPSGAALLVLCTDPMTAIDVPHLLQETGDGLLESTRSEGVLSFRIVRRLVDGGAG